MTRPGFIIPNAADATKSSYIAEPDAGDFDVIGRHTYGIYLGCDYTVSGSQFSVGQNAVNVFVIQGRVYVTRSDTTSVTILGSTSSAKQDRFDLIGYRLVSGVPQLQLIPGPDSTANRPVFPPIPDDMVLIASVFIPGAMTTWSGHTDVAEYVTDKRLMLLSGAKGAAGPSESFAVVIDPTTGQTNFTMTGDGSMFYANGATIKPELDKRITVTETLYANRLAGTDLNITLDGSFGGNISAANFFRGDGSPNDITTTATSDAPSGAIYQDIQGGRIFVKNSIGHWELLVPDGYPTGTIMPSILSGSHPWLGGLWLLCDGGQVSMEEAGNLWTLAPAGWKDTVNHVLTLPDLRQRVLMGAQIPGVIGEFGGENSYTLGEEHLPSHSHTVTLGLDGGHQHSVTTDRTGNHLHGVNDQGHIHKPNWYPHPNTQWINTQWGGKYGILGRDAIYAIARHFWPRPEDEPGSGGSSFGSGTGADQNPGSILAPDLGAGYGGTGISLYGAGDHSHNATTSNQPAHSHAVSVSNTGTQAVVGNQQQYMTINYFIKN